VKTLAALEDGGAGEGEEGTEQGGLFALPFMARALKKKRQAAEEEAKMLLEVEAV
jgi:U3 small nucleolar RNA-associated protein 14